MLTVAMLIAALEQGTDRRAWRSPTADQLAYFHQLRSWGYPLSDVEMLILTAGAPDPAEAGTDESDPDQQAEAQAEGIAVPDTGNGGLTHPMGPPGSRGGPIGSLCRPHHRRCAGWWSSI
ncbi:MAG: hypothetical protein ACRDST_23335 [Pseudonocardiaceae bacterium]